MRRHHYLGFQTIVGRSILYVALEGTRWVALLGWGSAALKCGARDRFLGWTPSMREQRLHFVANNARFLILPDARRPNLASQVLALNLKRLSQDWQLFHGHPILLAETFVDPARFRGTCYRAAGWLEVGHTLGFGKTNRSYRHHGVPKMILVRPLAPNAVQRLVAPFPPPISPQTEVARMFDVNKLALHGKNGLMSLLQTIIDPRKPRGVRHPVETVVAISICAALAGARSFCAIAEWAKCLDKDALRKLGSKRNEPPSEPTIRRVLQSLDADALDGQIGQWIMDNHPLAGRALAVDGKTLRGAHDNGCKPPHLLSIILHQEGVVVGQLAVEEKTNEIKKLPELLEPLAMEGAVVTADALHTQVETARNIVEKKRGDYLFIVKDNQPTLRQDIADLGLGAFPPSGDHNR
jgi:hypothetical protein